MRSRWLSIGAIIAVAVAGCAPVDDDAADVETEADEPEPEPAAEPEPERVESSARVACTHFRNVVGDADILSDAELREKIAEVHESARVSEEPGIAAGSREMLSTITGGDVDGFGAAVGEFAAACQAAGA